MTHVKKTFALYLAVAACSSDPSTPDDFDFRMAIDIAAGEEVEYCQYVTIPEAMDVDHLEHHYSDGSHHLVVYETDLTTEEAAADREVFDCRSRQDLRFRGVIYAAQVPDGSLDYPEGVAMRFEAGQVILVQSHYLNVTEAPLSATVVFQLRHARVPVEVEAGTLFYYDFNIAVPAGGAFTAKMHCEVPDDIEMVFAMSHMHRRGVAYRSWIVEPEAAKSDLYMGTSWENVHPEIYTPPRAVHGGDAIDFECDFENGEDRDIVEGPSADQNEMCMFVAGYWPRLDVAAERCAMYGSGPVYDGDKTCAESVACFQSATDPVAQENCGLSTCRASGSAFNAFGVCLFTQCPTCQTGGDDCQACVIENCVAEYGACQQATCD
jgi:hypothetical protein